MSDGTKKRSYATMAGENKSHSRQPGANHVVSNHNNTDDHSNETHTTERQHEGPTNPTTNNNLQLNTAAPLSASGNDTVEHGHGDNEAEGLGDDATVDEQHEDAAVGEEGEEADEGNQRTSPILRNMSPMVPLKDRNPTRRTRRWKKRRKRRRRKSILTM
jgi:hypothetical protein